jgi:hypothetical protein
VTFRFRPVLWIAVATLACGDGGEGPSEPVTLQIGGTWTQTSEVVADPCELVHLWGPPTSILRIAQVGVILTLIRDDEEIGGGSLTPETGDFVLTGSITEAGVTIEFEQRGTFTSSTHYTAETDLLIRGGAVICELRTSDTGVR